MSIAQRNEIEALKQRVGDLEKMVVVLRESLADLQGQKVMQQLASRETLSLPDKKRA